MFRNFKFQLQNQYFPFTILIYLQPIVEHSNLKGNKKLRGFLMFFVILTQDKLMLKC